MSDLLVGGLLPRRWHWDPLKVPFIEIIVNWQLLELDDQAQIKMPLLCEIHGHRRREVMGWFEETRDQRDAAIAQSIYGYPGACL